MAAGLAGANKAIAVGTLGGADVSTVLDTRDRLTLRLSELTGSTATIRPDGGADVTLDGVSLASGKDASVLKIATGATSTGGPDGFPISFSLTAPTSATTTMSSLPGGG